MYEKLYIYKGVNGWLLTKEPTNGLTYETFIIVPEVGDIQLFVYSSNKTACYISDKELTGPEWNLQFTFFAFRQSQGFNTKLRVLRKSMNMKIGTDIPRDGWVPHLEFYTMNEIPLALDIIDNGITNSNCDISIAMGYFNRREQLTYTLNTLEFSSIKNFEVVIVDDDSNQDNVLNDIITNYPFRIILARINSQYKIDKKYKNPCIVYNYAFDLCNSDKIIIQNPECCHIGDILNYVNSNLDNNAYIVFSNFTTSNLDQNITLMETYNGEDGTFKEFLTKIPPLPNKAPPWYSHPTARPNGYHFTTAINKSDLIRVGGFDTAYAFGYWYDDDQLIYSIKKRGIAVKLIPPARNGIHMLSIHQWHPRFTNERSDFNSLKERNSKIHQAFKLN